MSGTIGTIPTDGAGGATVAVMTAKLMAEAEGKRLKLTKDQTTQRSHSYELGLAMGGCGSGAALSGTAFGKISEKGKDFNWNDSEVEKQKMKAALNCVMGIDKDYFLSKVAKAYMTLIGDGTSGIFCEDSLENPQNWNEKTEQTVSLDKFDILLTNPPFGAKIPVRGEEKLKQFEFDFKNYFADHVNILVLKTKIC